MNVRMAFQCQLLKREIETHIAPEVTSSRAKASIGIIERLLNMLISELSTPAATTDELKIADRVIDSALAVLTSADRAGIGANLLRDRTRSVRSLVVIDESSAQRLKHDLGIAAARGVTDAARNGNKSTAAATRVVALLNDLADREELIEKRIVGYRVNPFVTFADSGGGVKGSTEWADPGAISVRDFQAYLRAHPAHPNDIQVHSLTMLPTGQGKDTFFAEVDSKAVGRESWVLRRDNPVPPLRSTVVDEFPLLNALRKTAVPVAEALWVEADATVFGAPLMAVRRVEGTSDIGTWMVNPSRAQAIAKRAAELLATIHSVDVGSLPTGELWRSNLKSWTPRIILSELWDVWISRRRESVPLVEVLFSWLDVRAPASLVRPALVHSDFGFHNMLVHGQDITSILDWEFAHFGDPHEDLAMLRTFVEPVMPWPEFMLHYRQNGGIEVDPDIESYYKVLSLFRIGICGFSWNSATIARNERLSLKCSTVAAMYARRFIIEAGRAAARVTTPNHF